MRLNTFDYYERSGNETRVVGDNRQLYNEVE
jgi:hypothetical protein